MSAILKLFDESELGQCLGAEAKRINGRELMLEVLEQKLNTIYDVP